MGKALFYHLTRQPLEAVLVILLTRSLGAGWRIAVHAGKPERVAWLDEKLWLDRGNDFLPHGCAGGAFDADQPILISSSGSVANSPDCIFSVDGADVAVAQVLEKERVCILFDGNDDTSLATARNQWKMMKNANAPAQYWSQDSGSWQMKAEIGGGD